MIELGKLPLKVGCACDGLNCPRFHSNYAVLNKAFNHPFFGEVGTIYGVRFVESKYVPEGKVVTFDANGKWSGVLP